MNVVVVTKNWSEADERHPMWERLRELGHRVVTGNPREIAYGTPVPDAIVCWSITLMDQAFEALERWPSAKLYCYNWDVYEWVWTRPRAEERPGTPAFLDYRRYGDLLKRAHEIWVPSECTGRRTTQWYGLTNWTRILSACPWWEHYKKCESCNGNAVTWHEDRGGQEFSRMCSDCEGTGKVSGVRDDGYALMCLREIPDPWWGVFERCCEELNIPYKAPQHKLSWEEYKDVVAGCRFICAPLYELSTGGLSLMEAYYHGKPVLLSDSEWNGGSDYFKGRANYFKHGNEADFKEALRGMYDPDRLLALSRSQIIAEDYKEYITTNFSDQRMAEDVHARLTR